MKWADMDSLSRRELIVGSSASALGMLLLAGCRSGGSGSVAGVDMPGPVWPVGSPRPTNNTPDFRSSPFQQPQAPVPPDSVYPAMIARSGWTRMGIARPIDIHPLGRVNRITIHHDGMNTFTSTSQSDAATRLELIRLSHVNKRGWADIGYHYVIDPAGRVWQARSTQYQGAHVENQNENNLGIMCLGNYDRQSATPATVNTLTRFVATQQRLYGVPTSRVYTHRELKPTECPGTSLQREIVRVRSSGALAATLQELGAGHLA